MGRSFGALELVLAAAVIAVASFAVLEHAESVFKRAYLTEAFGVTTRAGMVSYYATKGEWPASEGGLQRDYPGDDTDRILRIERVDWPTVVLTWGRGVPYAAGPQLVLDAATHPDGSTATIIGVCGRARPPDPYERVGDAETTLARSALPPPCRR